MKQKHGPLWEAAPAEGENTEGLYLGYGYPEPTELANVPIARDVFYNGRRIGGNLSLDE